MVSGSEGPDDGARDLKRRMNRRTETVTVDVSNAPELRSVVRWRGEFYRWISNVGNGTLKETRDPDLDIG